MASSIGTAWIQIKPSLSGVSSEIKKELGNSGADASSDFGNKFKTSFMSSAKSSFGEAFSEFGRRSDAAWASFAANSKAALAVAGAGIVGALTYAVKQYADYEQLIGGVQTLFKDNANAVIGFAKDAYKTAQLSANRYMETVTSFSASLLQGLNGDTAKAAKIANMAIIDMADNANKMGTSMESIQYAYQGFAKDNYTMLDNLKLGYGGTQSEMARLINDSGVMGTAFKATANNVSSIPFDKMIEAIHTIQERMGIAGTSAKEASQTISGSWNAAKSAFENYVTALGDPNADKSAYFDIMLDSARQLLANLAPVGKQIADSLYDEIKRQSPEAADALKSVFDTGSKVIDFINNNKALVVTLVEAFVAFKALQIGVGAYRAVMDTLAPYGNLLKGTWELVSAAAQSSAVRTAAAWTATRITMASEWIATTALSVIQAGMTAAAWVAGAVAAAAAWVVANAAILGVIGLIILVVVGAIAVIVANWSSIVGFFQWLWGTALNIVNGAINGIVGFFRWSWNNFVTIFSAVGGFFASVFNNAVNIVRSIFGGIIGFFQGIWNSITNIFRSVGSAIGNAISGTVRGAVNAVLTTAANIINGFINAINGAIGIINHLPGVHIGLIGHLGVPAFATGGPVFGAGSATSDSIPAMLSNGEYVIRAAAAQDIGYRNLDALNRGENIGGDQYTFGDIVINGYDKDPRELAQEISKEIALRRSAVLG